MTILPVGDYRPDVPPYRGTHATVATNVFPRPDAAMGPIKSGVSQATGLTGTPIQGFMARTGDGVSYLYCCTTNSAVIYRKYGPTFANYFTGATGAVTAMQPWRFAQFGSRVFATAPSHGLIHQVIGSADDFATVSAAPRAGIIATVEPGFLMLGNIDDGTARPNGLRWSALNDGADFPVVGTSDAASKQSDDQDLPNGGAVTAILPAVGGAAAAIFTEGSIYRAEYIGAPAVFAFRDVVRGAGNICPHGAIAVRGVAYYVGNEGFARFDGQNETLIGLGRVSQTFLDTVDRNNLHRVYVAHDPSRKILVWAYPTATATNGNPNRWLIYSYAADRWSFSDDAAIACALIFTATTDYIPLDLLDGYYPLGMDDPGTPSLDSEAINGGAPLLAGFTAAGAYVTYTGATLAALVETGETDANGRRGVVTGLRPMTDAGTVTAAVGYREGLASAPAYTALTPQEVTGICPQRISTRYARSRVYVPAAQSWTYLQGVDVMMKAGAKR